MDDLGAETGNNGSGHGDTISTSSSSSSSFMIAEDMFEELLELVFDRCEDLIQFEDEEMSSINDSIGSCLGGVGVTLMQRQEWAVERASLGTDRKIFLRSCLSYLRHYYYHHFACHCNSLLLCPFSSASSIYLCTSRH